MDILMVAAEMAPYVRESDAADAVLGLSKTLRQLGHEVTVAAPRHPGFEQGGLLVARRLTPLALGNAEAMLFDGQIASGVKLVLLDSPGLVGGEPARRAALLGLGIAALVRQRAELGRAPDVVHALDAAAALVPLALGAMAGRPGIVTTLQDASRSSSLGLQELGALGLPLEAAREASHGGRLDLIEAAVALGDTAAAAWPTQAEALLAGHFGERVAAVARARTEPLVGIAAGLDYATYNPATDVALPARYDAEHPEPKGSCKSMLERELRLPVEPGRVLAAAVGRVTRDEGMDLVLDALPELLDRDVALVVAGTGEGDPELCDRFAQAARSHPEAIGFVPAADEALRHRCFAAADLALVATRRLPGGITHAIAQRYGAFPVAAAVGSARDGVIDCDAELTTGTGFLFEDASAASLIGALGRALGALAMPAGRALRRRIMRLELGWDRPARRYLQLYRRAIERLR
jgi:starch synthase